jgi:hypothetical protein
MVYITIDDLVLDHLSDSGHHPPQGCTAATGPTDYYETGES